MSQNGKWGSELEALICAQIINRPVTIWSAINGTRLSLLNFSPNNRVSADAMIHLAYSGTHYNALINCDHSNNIPSARRLLDLNPHSTPTTSVPRICSTSDEHHATDPPEPPVIPPIAQNTCGLSKTPAFPESPHTTANSTATLPTILASFPAHLKRRRSHPSRPRRTHYQFLTSFSLENHDATSSLQRCSLTQLKWGTSARRTKRRRPPNSSPTPI
jgi:hypothetical protein